MWTSIQRTFPLFAVPPGDVGSSELPWKKVTFTYLVKTWNDRNQPAPSTPQKGEFHRTHNFERSVSCPANRASTAAGPDAARRMALGSFVRGADLGAYGKPVAAHRCGRELS